MQYVYALGTRPLAAARNGAAWEYLLPDALGSVRQIVDANGNVTLAESYEPYGNVLTSTGTASSIFAYAGEQIDTYIKLLFLRSRYYSPETARFLSKDAWQGDYTRPQSLNAWMYVEGDPINQTDPSGLSTCHPLQDTERCRKWVESALGAVANGGNMSRAFLDKFYSDANSTYWFIGIGDSSIVYPIIPFIDFIVLPASYLSDQLPLPFSHLGWFVHETTHSFRNPSERTTTFGEVEATAVQVGVLKEVGGDGAVEPYMTRMLIAAMDGDQVTRDLGKLAQARCILSEAYGGGGDPLRYPQGWFYRHEALIFNHDLEFFGDEFCGCPAGP